VPHMRSDGAGEEDWRRRAADVLVSAVSDLTFAMTPYFFECADLRLRSAPSTAVLLARTNDLVKGRSNLSDASLVFNESLPYSLCLK